MIDLVIRIKPNVPVKHRPQSIASGGCCDSGEGVTDECNRSQHKYSLPMAAEVAKLGIGEYNSQFPTMIVSPPISISLTLNLITMVRWIPRHPPFLSLVDYDCSIFVMDVAERYRDLRMSQ
ncbi:hypothetical protein [Novipirellula sp.]|uniref:hypothetical protein n=1 Tax=Novipirellula sp. TaxID=2795430 RepID=UPI003568622A